MTPSITKPIKGSAKWLRNVFGGRQRLLSSSPKSNLKRLVSDSDSTSSGSISSVQSTKSVRLAEETEWIVFRGGENVANAYTVRLNKPLRSEKRESRARTPPMDLRRPSDEVFVQEAEFSSTDAEEGFDWQMLPGCIVQPTKSAEEEIRSLRQATVRLHAGYDARKELDDSLRIAAICDRQARACGWDALLRPDRANCRVQVLCA